ncbi:hypothetical protein SRABI27_00342 [Pedobacter sp. Bi27]|nr:hypothetical protein SRABI27_00342 [Pedobacter sp. Bi27]
MTIRININAKRPGNYYPDVFIYAIFALSFSLSALSLMTRCISINTFNLRT